jgi:hypothetical protein
MRLLAKSPEHDERIHLRAGMISYKDDGPFLRYIFSMTDVYAFEEDPYSPSYDLLSE